MTFGSVFGRTFSPTFQPSSQAAAVASGGWWDLNGAITSCIAAYQAKGAASYAASKVNLANAGTYDLSNGTAYPTWDTSTGWTFTQANSEYLTGATLSGLAQDSFTIIFHSSINASGKDKGVFDIGPVWLWYTYKNTFIRGRYYTTSNTNYIPAIAGAAVYCFSNTAGYRDGEKLVDIATGTGTTSDTLTVGKSAGGYHNGTIRSFALYGAVLTSTQIGNLTTAMAAL